MSFLSIGGFLKWWYPTTMGFPTKNDHFGVFWGYHHLRKQPIGVFFLGGKAQVAYLHVFLLSQWIMDP